MPPRTQPCPPPPGGPQAPGHGGAPQGAAAAAGPRRVASDDLFAGAVEVQIEHREQVYRLRRTSLGKLILTK
jgi:hemin uptake protein HemP